MNKYKILRGSATAAALAFAAIVRAMPIVDYDVAGSVQWVTSTGRVANVVYGFSKEVTSNHSGSRMAGATSVFLAESFGNTATASTNKSVGLGAITTGVADGLTQASTVVTDQLLSAGATATSRASAFGDAFVIGIDNKPDLHSSASAQASGLSSSGAVFADGLVSTRGGASSRGAGASDSLISAEDVLALSKSASLASTLGDAFAHSAADLAGSGDASAAALALGVGDALTMSAQELLSRNETSSLTENSFSDTASTASGDLLASRGKGDFLGVGIGDVFATTPDARLHANTRGTTVGSSHADSFIDWTLDHRYFTAGGSAGFLSAVSEGGFSEFADSADFFRASSGVKAIAFGYTQTWIRVPEPATLALLGLGLAWLGLIRHCMLRRAMSSAVQI